MIGIITARGGSVRLPGKNVRKLDGRPLIHHTIRAARESNAIDRIVLSTDDPHIAEVAKEAGAEVPFMRPKELSHGNATSRDVLLHAVGVLEEAGEGMDAFCLLQPTSPLRTAEDIDGAVALFMEKEADSVIGVTEFEHPLEWMLELNESHRIVDRNPLRERVLPEGHRYDRPNGAVYIFRTAFFKRAETYIGENTYGYPMPPERSVDIDTRLDFLIAEAIIRETRATT